MKYFSDAYPETITYMAGLPTLCAVILSALQFPPCHCHVVFINRIQSVMDLPICMLHVGVH